MHDNTSDFFMTAVASVYPEMVRSVAPAVSQVFGGVWVFLVGVLRLIVCLVCLFSLFMYVCL